VEPVAAPGKGRPLCFVRLKARWLNESAMQLDDVRSEIERMRTQIHRHRGEIYQLQRAGNVVRR